jgi:phosphonate transport system substrate-binding protein
MYSQSLINSNDDKANTINIIFSHNSFYNIKLEDAHATAQLLANHIKKLKNLKNDFKVDIVNNDKEILEKYKSEFDLMLLPTEQYLRLKKKMPLEPFCVNYTNNSFGYIYHLIVNKDDYIKDIAQLKGETINIQAHTNDQAVTLWLDKLLRESKLQSKENYFSKVVLDSKATNVLLPVFFKKAKACIVTNSSLNLLMELNPGIKNQIKILYTSEPLILGITCLNSNKKDTDDYKTLKEVLLSLHENDYGKQLLSLFGTDKLILFKEEYLNGYFNLTK